MERNNPKLSAKALKIILAEPVLYISQISVWELAIKVKTGKLDLDQALSVFIESFLNSFDAELLNISLPHIYQTQQLPLHHRDPFDRLLIAQANIEQIPIVSSDEWFDQYEVQRIW